MASNAGTAFLKSLPQGYILTAPAMVILLLVGQKGTLGTIQAIGGLVSACILYRVGGVPQQRRSRDRIAGSGVLAPLGVTLLFGRVDAGKLNRIGGQEALSGDFAAAG